MIHSIACIFRHFIGILRNYIHGRMNGMPYFFETHEPTTQTTSSSPSHSLTMPAYIQEGIGKYGNEISGTLSKKDSIETLRNYIESLDLPTNKTYHTFEDCLSRPEYNALQDIKYSEICARLSHAHPKHILTPIVSMNELYVSCIGADGSDRVFETPHIDGFFAWLPWCIVYRVVVSIQGNRQVDTVFPLSQHKYTLETGDYVAFDYNRSIHYIVGNSPSAKTLVDTRKRIILKLHYLVYPEWLPVWVSRVYVEIHGNYNAFLRALFLKSQFTYETPNVVSPGILHLRRIMTLEKEETVLQRWISAFINNGTTLYVKLFLIGLYLYNNFRNSFVVSPGIAQFTYASRSSLLREYRNNLRR